MRSFVKVLKIMSGGRIPGATCKHRLPGAGRAAHEEMLAACAPSKIPQLYATPQDVVMAPGTQEPPRRGKDQLEQNVNAGLCIEVSGKTLLLGHS